MASPDSGAPGLHILVIEDTREDFEVIESHLRRTGLQFSSRRIGAPQEVSRELDRQPPHLVLCDHSHARIDTLRVLELVRARSRTLPFIVVTGSRPEAQLADAFTRGADDLVPRERLEDLAPAVHRALRLSEVRQQLADAEAERDRLRSEVEAWRFGHPRTPTMLPICAGCKKIRDLRNEWIQLESYLHDHFNIRFSHGICFGCLQTFMAGKP
jgi:CheY-like chemotaxis protein